MSPLGPVCVKTYASQKLIVNYSLQQVFERGFVRVQGSILVNIRSSFNALGQSLRFYTAWVTFGLPTPAHARRNC